MCMATPVRIKSKIKEQKSKVIVDGDKEVDVSLIEDPKVGDWLLCHETMAINKISEEEAQNILGLIKTCNHHH